MFSYGNKNMDKQIEKMLYFTNQDLAKFMNPISVNTFLERETKKGNIIRLKRGIYTTKAKRTEIQIDREIDPYLAYLTTNILTSPSYLSLEWVLFAHNIIIENVYTMTAVTTKNRSKITNKLGRFERRNINDDLFWGFEAKKVGDFVYYQAYPEKALLDHLRLKKDIAFEESYFEELRLEIDRLNFKRLTQFVRKFNKRKIDKCFTYLSKLR
ncbi:MAG: hypothetical protein LBI53_05015 [Candidatus Peribacteria bacterium]|jgi:predicted transcriptional regulator of viral defense system|nr:hypothetical protein [Candidatus Peribacteria bacterium]